MMNTSEKKEDGVMKKKSAILLSLLLLLAVTVPMAAAEETIIEIHSAEDLAAIADHPTGSYVLMQDLDMSGILWKSIDFSGSFDGNGHSILNLTLAEPGEKTPESCDGNKIMYESRYVGLFGTLTDAQVKNLHLINVRGCIETDESCFVGGIAGYMESSVIADCTVTGCMELRAHDRMFGIGGVVGYGGGSVESCSIDVTLICVDTDAETKDEQFLGGVYSTGFIDVVDCDITLDGYISDHGYVHSGGITGMYMEYPLGTGTIGRVCDNSITGKITFFEDNLDRRAYCKVLFGEVLINNCRLEGNISDFKRDETFDYSRELRPNMCEDAQYEEIITPPGCDSFGYTTCICNGCGYSYTDRYTLPTHTVSEWTLKNAPTTEKEGLSVGVCDLCGAEQTRTGPTLPTEPETTQPQTTVPETQCNTTEETVSDGDLPEDGEGTSLHTALLFAMGLIACFAAFSGIRRRKQNDSQS